MRALRTSTCTGTSTGTRPASHPTPTSASSLWRQCSCRQALEQRDVRRRVRTRAMTFSSRSTAIDVSSTRPATGTNSRSNENVTPAIQHSRNGSSIRLLLPSRRLALHVYRLVFAAKSHNSSVRNFAARTALALYTYTTRSRSKTNARATTFVSEFKHGRAGSPRGTSAAAASR